MNAVDNGRRRMTNLVGAIFAALCAFQFGVLWLPGDIDGVRGALVAAGGSIAVAALGALLWVTRVIADKGRYRRASGRRYARLGTRSRANLARRGIDSADAYIEYILPEQLLVAKWVRICVAELGLLGLAMALLPVVR
jgi:hypothetical protein